MSIRRKLQFNNLERVGEEVVDNNLAEILNGQKREWARKLQTEDYQEAQEALAEIKDLKEWRNSAKRSSFGKFYQLFEDVNILKNTKLPKEDVQKVVDEFTDKMFSKTQTMSPRVADLYSGFVAEISGKQYQPKFEITKKQIEKLKAEENFDLLINPRVSFHSKVDRMEKRLERYLQWAKWKDRERDELTKEEKEVRREKLKNQPVKPPTRKNESKPSMDEINRLEKEERVEAIWTINPAYGGYFKEQLLSHWDNEQNKWTEEYEYFDAERVPLLENETEEEFNISLKAGVDANQWINLSIPYTHDLHSIKAEGRDIYIKKDQNGDVVFLVSGTGEVNVEVVLAFVGKKKLQLEKPTEKQDFKSNLSEETRRELENIGKSRIGNIKKAEAIKSFIARTIKYSNKSAFNAIYDNHPKGYIGAIDEYKEADCDVANTYFAALCAELEIPVRHCIGHSVNGKDEEGNSQIHSETGHAWSEVWDEINNEWVRIDATPSGDRQLEGHKEGDGESDGENIPGDFRKELESRPMTDEEIEELERQMEELTEQLSYTLEEQQLTETTGVELPEARQILDEIQKAENTRLPNGERMADVLAKLFNLIIESRKTTSPSYTSPVRKREGGGEIEDIVAHYIGVQSGDPDPISRQRPDLETNKEEVFGGMDVYIASDKTASTNKVANKETGETVNELQRRAVYSIFSALHRFSANLEQSKTQMQDELSVRTQGISYRGNKMIDEDKKLGGRFDAEDKVKMWKSLADTKAGRGADVAMKYIYQEIRKELENKGIDVENGETDNRLRFVVVFSDGEFGREETEKTHQYAEALGKMGVVMLGVGLTKTANNIPVVFNTKWSRGDFTDNLNDLPAIVAKHLVQEAIKLFPEKARQQSQQVINAILDKFKNV